MQVFSSLFSFFVSKFFFKITLLISSLTRYFFFIGFDVSSREFAWFLTDLSFFPHFLSGFFVVWRIQRFFVVVLGGFCVRGVFFLFGVFFAWDSVSFCFDGLTFFTMLAFWMKQLIRNNLWEWSVLECKMTHTSRDMHCNWKRFLIAAQLSWGVIAIYDVLAFFESPV